jgi:two-component system response regulator PhoP
MLLLQIGEKPFRRADEGEAFARRGIQRTLLRSPKDAETFLETIPYDSVFVDLDLPGHSGEGIVGSVRRIKPQVPLFAFSYNLDLRFKIRILDLGADEVMTQLCPIDELLARVRAVLRRLEHHTSSTLKFGPLQVMMDRRTVTAKGELLPLSPMEYRFLELLVRRHGEPVTRDTCLSYLYTGKEEPDVKAIDVLVWRLRRKLAAHGCGNILRNVWGHGFRLHVEPPSAHSPPACRGVAEVTPRTAAERAQLPDDHGRPGAPGKLGCPDKSLG